MRINSETLWFIKKEHYLRSSFEVINLHKVIGITCSSVFLGHLPCSDFTEKCLVNKNTYIFVISNMRFKLNKHYLSIPSHIF